jgi:hypothetical protein
MPKSTSDLNDLTGDSNSPEDRKKPFEAQTYPFSSAIPGILREMHLMLLRFFIFSVKNPLLGLKGEAVCGATMKVFRFINKTLQGELERGGDGVSLPLSKACQISIDARALSLASDTIWALTERVLDHFQWDDVVSKHLITAIQVRYRV